MKTRSGRVFLFSILLLSPAYSEENFIDLFHREISHLVHSTVEKVDQFFADPRIKEETRSYLRLRTGFRYTTEPYYSEIFKLDFKIRLTKLEKKVKLLFKDESRKTGSSENNRDKKITLLKHRLSLGISGIPKTYAKYEVFNIPFIYKRWEITIYQRFKAIYKIYNYKLEERTQIYIDRLIAPDTIWRIFVERYNSSDLPYQRVNYYTSVRIYSKERKTAMELLSGIGQEKLIGGRTAIYTAQYRVRTNIWRKWAFFNIHVGSNWERERGFKGTPFLLVYFEFYAGKY